MIALRDLFLLELADIYDAEQQLTDALPEMAEAAEFPELKTGFENHLNQTKTHIQRLEQVFTMFGQEAEGEKCKAMKGLIAEGEALVKKEVGDAGLIAAAQKVEHYEIAAYGTLRNWAEMLGESEAANLLQQTLDEEKETDEKLTALAESSINDAAKHAPTR